MTRARIALAALAYAALVAHLLFIPYAFSPLPFDAALRRFAHIPWLQLGSDQNVALVSRALMFLPLGLLLAAWVAPHPRRRFEWPAAVVACLFGWLWAAGVNVAQFWFPSRTISLNNLAAEFIGVAGGALLWCALGANALRWWRQLASGGRVGLKAALSGYAVLYLVASLTPFDFVASGSQLAAKAASELYGLWRAPIGCGSAPCELKFLLALCAAIPCGWWYAAQRPRANTDWLAVVLVALFVATSIELLHFLMVSGVSQGASVLVRASGMVLGVATYSWRDRLPALDLVRVVRPAVLALLAPYLVALAYVGGWFRAEPLGIHAGLARLDGVVWLPFYYQYYTAYQSTMYSTVVHIALYAPVGVACWLWSRRRDRIPLWRGALLAGLISLAAETSKLLLAGRLPDYTDVFIAVTAATLALAVLRFVSRVQSPAHDVVATRPFDSLGTPRDAVRVAAPIAQSSGVSAGRRVVGLSLLVVAGLSVLGFPVARWPLALGLVGYAALLVRFPTATYVLAVSSLLPLLDLAPYSGRFFWDEFDLLLATTLGVRLLIPLPLPQARVPMPQAALWLLFASVAASTAIGVWPPAAIDANAFSNYFSPYNALRIAKGYAWAGALLWLMWRDAVAGRSVAAPLQLGLALGLFAATISVYWERLLFLGSPDLGNAFRAAGFVSANHVGGAYLEAVLVMLAPFGLALAATARRFPQRLLGYGLTLSGAGAILLTFSRAALAAWAASMAVFAAVWWLKSRRSRVGSASGRWRMAAGLALLATFALTLQMAQSSYLRARLALSKPDLALRVAHWSEAIDLMHTDALHMVLGMGLGSFPREFYLAEAGALQLPAYRVERDAISGWRYLVLTGGRGMYMDQRIAARPGSELLLSGLVRSPRTDGNLSVSLCAKSLLNAVSCSDSGVFAGPAWQRFAVRLKAPGSSRAFPRATAPLSLSLHNGAFGSRVEVTQLALLDSEIDLLRNGSFEHGLDRWFVTSDVHLAWRVLSTPLQIAFEQGALGIVCWLVLSVAALVVIGRSDASPGLVAAFAAAVVGFLVVSCFDSLLDSPRVILLLALVGAAGIFSCGGYRAAPSPPAAVDAHRRRPGIDGNDALGVEPLEVRQNHCPRD